MAIKIIFGKIRVGKTALMTHLLNLVAFDRNRYKLMRQEINNKNDKGFNLTLPECCCSANYEINFRRFGYTPRRNRLINPFRLGFANEYVQTHFNFPYEVIGIDEGQKYLNSRMSMYFPDWQSRWYEQSGHNYIDVYIATQRPNLIDVNIREISEFIEVVSLTLHYDNKNQVDKLTWKVRHINSSFELDKYMSSGKTDNSTYTEEEVVADYNVFACYDSRNCKPLFYKGHLEEDFDIKESSEVDESLEGYIKYLEEKDDELPVGFYKKRSVA